MLLAAIPHLGDMVGLIETCLISRKNIKFAPPGRQNKTSSRLQYTVERENTPQAKTIAMCKSVVWR
jgi:hypothetical protein